MAIERDDADERQARIDAMIGQFREAQKRRMVRRGLALWKRAEANERAKAHRPAGLPEKIH